MSVAAHGTGVRTSPTETVASPPIEWRAAALGALAQTVAFVGCYLVVVETGASPWLLAASLPVGGLVAGWVGRGRRGGYADGLAASTGGVLGSWVASSALTWLVTAGASTAVRGDLTFIVGVFGLTVLVVFVPVWIVVGAVAGALGSRLPVSPPRVVR